MGGHGRQRVNSKQDFNSLLMQHASGLGLSDEVMREISSSHEDSLWTQGPLLDKPVGGQQQVYALGGGPPERLGGSGGDDSFVSEVRAPGSTGGEAGDGLGSLSPEVVPIVAMQDGMAMVASVSSGTSSGMQPEVALFPQSLNGGRGIGGCENGDVSAPAWAGSPSSSNLFENPKSLAPYKPAQNKHGEVSIYLGGEG
jgi:hypothetical protein